MAFFAPLCDVGNHECHDRCIVEYAGTEGHNTSHPDHHAADRCGGAEGAVNQAQQIKMIAQRTGNEDEYENDGDLTIAKALQEFVSGDDTRNDEDQHGDEKDQGSAIAPVQQSGNKPDQGQGNNVHMVLNRDHVISVER